MKKLSEIRARSGQEGFTLVELLVVVLIIGILAAIAIPQYFKVVEKSRAAEGPATFDAIRGSEERYLAQYSQYFHGNLQGGCLLDLCPNNNYPTLSGFTSAAITGGVNDWQLILSRTTNVTGYGQYSMTYNVTIGQPPTLTISNGVNPNMCIELGLPNNGNNPNICE